MLSSQMNRAEQLLTIARDIKEGKNRLWVVDSALYGPGPSDTQFALICTALAFEKQRAGLILQALVEDWDLPRINREIY